HVGGLAPAGMADDQRRIEAVRAEPQGRLPCRRTANEVGLGPPRRGQDALRRPPPRAPFDQRQALERGSAGFGRDGGDAMSVRMQLLGNEAELGGEIVMYKKDIAHALFLAKARV